MTGLAAPRISYGSVLGDREFRAVFIADAVSLLGDQIARIAVAVLVLDRTGSAFAASATYACSYLSWLIGGPVLSAIADLLPRRRTMVTADVARALLVGLLVIPGMPIPVIFILILAVGFLSPPFEAARSALLADVLAEDRYVVGNALINTMGQLAQVGGFVLGGGLVAALGSHGALLVDALSFALSALLLVVVVRDRPLPPRDAQGESFRNALTGGVRVIAADRNLAALLGWSVLVAGVTIPPEGLAVAVARNQGGGSLAAGVLTAAVPGGFVVGSWLLLRLAPPTRRRLFPWLALLSSAPLALSSLASGLTQLGVLWAVAGLGTSLATVANPLFVQAVPRELRGRAFGVAATAMMTMQGVVLLAAGALAEYVGARGAVSALAVAGLALLIGATLFTAFTHKSDVVRDHLGR